MLPRYVKKHNFHIARKLTFIVLNLCISVSIAIRISSQKIKTTLLEIATMQTSKYSSVIVNNSIQEVVLDELDNNVAIEIAKKEDGTPASINFNTYIINKIVSKAVMKIYQNIIYLEKGKIEEFEFDNVNFEVSDENLKKGIIYQIPYGLIFKSPLIANMGPLLPVKFSLIGDVVSNVKSNISQYGINNALIEVEANIKIKMQVIIPLASTISDLNYNIPLAAIVVQGNVPTYYQGSNSLGENNFVVPLD